MQEFSGFYVVSIDKDLFFVDRFEFFTFGFSFCSPLRKSCQKLLKGLLVLPGYSSASSVTWDRRFFAS